MQIRSWKDQSLYIWTAIKRISDYHGKDDHEWLRNYAHDIILTYRDNLQPVIDCFEDVASQLIYARRQS